MRHRALPESVEAAPVEIVAPAVDVLRARIVGRHHDAFVETRRLVRKNAGSAHARLEESGDQQGLIANRFAGQAEARPPRE